MGNPKLPWLFDNQNIVSRHSVSSKVKVRHDFNESLRLKSNFQASRGFPSKNHLIKTAFVFLVAVGIFLQDILNHIWSVDFRGATAGHASSAHHNPQFGLIVSCSDCPSCNDQVLPLQLMNGLGRCRIRPPVRDDASRGS
jgi:hypothetical protein